MKLYLPPQHHLTKNLAKLYPNKIGCCIQPDAWVSNPQTPYFIDNGAYSDFRQNRPFRKEAFLKLLNKANELALSCDRYPDFVVVPDRVGDPETTNTLWNEWSQKIRQINNKFKLAYVVQPTLEGGFPEVPKEADIIFTGGLKPWKFQAVIAYRNIDKPIHVGGISASQLYWCHFQGAASGDSTGFFRGDMTQLQKLYNYLADTAGQLEPLKAPEFLRKQKPTNQLTLF